MNDRFREAIDRLSDIVPDAVGEDKEFLRALDDVVAAGFRLSQPPSGDAPDLREALRQEARIADHGSIPDGPAFARGIRYALDRLAASAPSSPATPAPLPEWFPDVAGELRFLTSNEGDEILAAARRNWATPAPLEVDLLAAVKEWADSEDVVRSVKSPSREQWERVLLARANLRAYANQEGTDAPADA